MTATIRTVLHRLLDSAAALPPEYEQGLSSHLPMALHALAELGADGARLQAFHDRYLHRFDGRPAMADTDAAADWRRLLGDSSDAAYPALRAAFARALAADGSGATLRAALPLLLQGVAAAAFHGAIRTAHAVEAGHAGELAAALAYWAWRWQPVAVAVAAEPAALPGWTAALERAGGRACSSAGLISERMRALGPLQSRLLVDDETLPRLAAWAAGRYAASGNFTVLHIVTGCRALGVLARFVDARAALAQAAPAIAAAYRVSRIDPVAACTPARTPAPAPGWPVLAAAAVGADDDHVVKLVHACRQLATAADDATWRAAAARALG